MDNFKELNNNKKYLTFASGSIAVSLPYEDKKAWSVLCSLLHVYCRDEGIVDWETFKKEFPCVDGVVKEMEEYRVS